MFRLKLHKYFYSFILLVSLASFTGYATTSNTIVTITELVDYSNGLNSRSISYSDYLKVNITEANSLYSVTNFKTLLNVQNNLYILRLNRLQTSYRLLKSKQLLFFLKTLLQNNSYYFQYTKFIR